MSTVLEDQLHRSIIYRRLIDDLERLVIGEWSASEKQRMVGAIHTAVGEALKDYTLRCSKCDAPIDPICEECQ